MRILGTFLLIFVFSAGFSQNNLRIQLASNEKKGDHHFYLFSYDKALSAYQLALKRNPDEDRLELKIAETYRLLNQAEKTAEYYGKVTDNQSIIKPIHKLHYAEALSAIGQYDQAKVWYEKYKTVAKEDSRSERALSKLQNLDYFFKDSLSFHVNTLNINSEEADFSPTYYDDGIVFVSSREPKKGFKIIYNLNESKFLDLYYSLEHEDGTNAPADRFHRNVNTQLHEGPTAFYANDTKMIFTRNNLINGKKGESSDGIIKLKLYFSEKSNESWSKPVEFPYNSDEYSVGHPTITEDGKRLFFASDMPGGYGGTDIYSASFEDGEWSEPQNLGTGINTEGNEMFPYYNESLNELYFSSNGHGGLGGLDIYRQSLSSNSEPSNLRYPINTKADDFGFIVAPNGQSGYFSSNRKGGKGDDDIYHFSVQNEILDVLVYDKKTGDALSSARIELHEGSKLAALSKTNPGGEAMFQVNPKKNYILKVFKADYQPAEVLIDLTQLLAKDFVEVKVPLVYAGQVPAANTETEDTEDHYRRLVLGAEGLKEIDPVVNLVDTTIVPVNISAEKSTPPKVQYFSIRNHSGNKQDFLVFSDELMFLEGANFVSTDGKGLKIISHHARPTSKEIIFGLENLGYLVDFEEITNIYYDLDKSLIRNDASVELDQLVNLLSVQPEFEVQLSSFTDSRGSVVYNQKLSLMRVEAAKDYLLSEGIEEGRIHTAHFEEQQLVNDCADGIDCEENAHQLNRRTEINIKVK